VSKCYIRNNNENLGKYDDRADEGIFLGYATNNKLVDCIDIKVDEGIPIREVRNIESTTKDIVEVEDE
jgi:hypothetical protein